MIESVIFDLDGTLVNTEPVSFMAVTQVLGSLGIELDEAVRPIIRGRTWSWTSKFFFERFKISISPTELETRVMDTYGQLLQSNLREVSGSAEAVRTLSQRYPLGLVTGSKRLQAMRILEQLSIRNCFSVILTAEDYLQPKPHPEGYLMALSKLGVPANRTLVFEDSEIGIAAARCAGTWVTAVGDSETYYSDPGSFHFKIENFLQVTHEWIHQVSLAFATSIPHEMTQSLLRD